MRRRILGLAVLTALAGSAPALGAIDSGADLLTAGTASQPGHSAERGRPDSPGRSDRATPKKPAAPPKTQPAKPSPRPAQPPPRRPSPTATPQPARPTPTATPQSARPTSTPQPAKRPVPTATPRPAKRPVPTATPQPTRPAPAPTELAPDGTNGVAPANTLFASSFADGLSEYLHQTHPERISVVDDPMLGPARKVLRFQVHPGDTGPTENPRAQLETPYDFREGDDRYFGFSLYFPADFPADLPSRGWVTVGEQAYGPPYDGAGGVGLRVQNAPGGEYAELRWQRNDSYGWDMPWRGPRIDRIRGRWIDIVQRIKLHRDPGTGFVEMWMNTGDGFQRQALSGQDRLYMSTYDAANNGGANNSRLALYYRNDIPGPLTVFHGPHRIAAAGPGAFSAVAPTSYGVATAEP